MAWHSYGATARKKGRGWLWTMSEEGYSGSVERTMTVIQRRKARPWRFLAVMAMFAAGAVAADTPCHDKNLPSELCTPEPRSGFGMVSTGSPQATKVAVDILEKGGNAIDAAVAAALTLGVVESPSSGIGGHTYILVHLAGGRTLAIDGGSRSPLSIDIERFREFKTKDLTYGYETIAAQTTLASLEFARSRYGTLDMAELLQPAIELAENGFPLSKIQSIKTHKYYDHIIKSSPYLASIVLKDGHTIGELGDHRRMPDLAIIYRRLAKEGVWSFYAGSIADEIEADMIRGGSFLRKADLRAVSVREIRPLMTTYRGYQVFAYPPPGGGAAVVTILNLLETFPSDFLATDSVERHHALLETFRIAMADARAADAGRRIDHLDPLTKRHAYRRSKLFTPGEMIPKEMISPPRRHSDCLQPGGNTTHVSVADNLGNVVSLTQTLSRSYGAKVATRGFGFAYNNTLAVFNADGPRCPGYLRPNTPIMTAMSPTVVLKGGVFFAALGAPGSDFIPPMITEVISNLVDRKMGIRAAVTAPRILWSGNSKGESVDIEVFDPISEEDVEALRRMGFTDVRGFSYPPRGQVKMNSLGGINAVAYDLEKGKFTGVGDPRRYGSAMGPKTIAAHE